MLECKPIEHYFHLVAMPSENIKGHISDYTEVKQNGEVFDIIDIISIEKGNNIPSWLQYLAYNKKLDEEELFKTFTKIYFIICKKKECNSI